MKRFHRQKMNSKNLHLKKRWEWGWCATPLILAFRKQRQAEFSTYEVSLVSRTERKKKKKMSGVIVHASNFYTRDAEAEEFQTIVLFSKTHSESVGFCV